MQKKTDALSLIINVFATLVGLAFVTVAVVSPWLAVAFGDWMGVPSCLVLGAMGAWLLKIQYGDYVRMRFANRKSRRAARRRAAELLNSTLTTRPEAYSYVRVLEPVWTPFGTLHTDDAGVVLPSIHPDRNFVIVRWPLGESVHDFRELASDQAA